MTTKPHLIDRFGGTQAFARRFGLTSSQVSNYRHRGIPAYLHLEVVEAARSDGVRCSPEDLERPDGRCRWKRRSRNA